MCSTRPPRIDLWEATRARIAIEGFGARLLALQDADGQWAGGSFFPADFDFHGSQATQGGQPWTATTWTLNSLREWGLDPGVTRERRTAEVLAENSRWDYNNLPFWSGEVDCCIDAWTVANGVWLGADITGIVDWFLEHRLPDGDWNREWVEGSTRSSFHSTLNSLKGLLAYDAGTGGADATRAARHSGQEYLLQRGLFRRLSTGEPVAPWVDQFVYPFRWTYNVLNAAEYFRQASLLDGVAPDPRMMDASDSGSTRLGCVSFGSPKGCARRQGAQKRLGERNQRATSDAEKHTGDEYVPVAHRDDVVAPATG